MTVTILGGGISGLSCAINLGKAGIRNVVYEKEKAIGSKHDYHISAIRNYDLKKDAIEELRDFGVSLKPSNSVKKVYRLSPNFCSVLYSEKPVFYLFKRGSARDSIESQLFSQLTKNTEVYLGFNGNLSPDVIASGAKRADVFGFGYVFKGLNMENAVYIFYDNRYAPGGYVCVLPSGKEGFVLSVIFKKEYFKRAKSLLNSAILENRVLSGMTDGAERLNVFSCYSSLNSNRKKTICIGEAGGFQDASKGFGIRYAIISGCLAAKSIIEGKDFSRLCEFLRKEFKENKKFRMFANRATNDDYDRMVKGLGKEVSL
ncbi:MAG: NAD(P)-binding protein, partial [Candidatus Aenigmatarchaeota archaeon]